jgi:hypothetical protein
MIDSLQFVWSIDVNESVRDPGTCLVVGRTWTFGPFLFGSFRKLSERTDAFWFINIIGTRLGVSWE